MAKRLDFFCKFKGVVSVIVPEVNAATLSNPNATIPGIKRCNKQDDCKIDECPMNGWR